MLENSFFYLYLYILVILIIININSYVSSKSFKIGVLGSMHTGQHILILRIRYSSNFELSPDYDHGGKRLQMTPVKCQDIDGKIIRIAVVFIYTG